jgi:hypothetical protein
MILATQVIVDEDAQALMVITQKRISACGSSDFQRTPGCGERKGQNGYCLEGAGVLGKGAVVSNHGDVEA